MLAKIKSLFEIAFRIRPDEFALVQAFLLYYLCIGAFYTLALSIGESLFLANVDPERVENLFAFAYIGIAVATPLATWGYNLLQGRFQRIALLLGTQIALAASLGGFWDLIAGRRRWQRSLVFLLGRLVRCLRAAVDHASIFVCGRLLHLARCQATIRLYRRRHGPGNGAGRIRNRSDRQCDWNGERDPDLHGVACHRCGDLALDLSAGHAGRRGRCRQGVRSRTAQERSVSPIYPVELPVGAHLHRGHHRGRFSIEDRPGERLPGTVRNWRPFWARFTPWRGLCRSLCNSLW